MSEAHTLRAFTSTDTPFLEEMLCEAMNWDPSRPERTVDEVRRTPELWRYVEGWPRNGDFGVLAINDAGVRIGAAWARSFSKANHGYGFVRESVPELGMGVSLGHRGEGLGGELLDALLRAARARGVEAVSLSVEDGNTGARRLYERRRFEVVGRRGNSDVLMLSLT